MNKETLKSRERVIRAIEHKPVDRVTLDFGMHFSSGISAFAYYDLLEYLGYDTQSVLNLGTTDEIIANVKSLMEVFKPNSGFIYNQVHNIMGDIAPEKIVAMYDTACESSFY